MSPAGPPKGAAKVFEAVIDRLWRRVFNFAFRMTLHRDDACAITEETFLRAYVGQQQLPTGDVEIEAWLLRIANYIAEQRVDEESPVSFELLDETLRSEATRTQEVSSLTNPQRDYLLWELKQGCMTAVINCLPPGERVAFVLGVMLGRSEEEAARILGINTSAFKVRLSRARKKVSGYLAPRCEHVNPANPCHCPSRLGIALQKGFVAPPPSSDVKLRAQPFGRYGGAGEGDAPLRDVMTIYQTLPEPDPPPDLGEKLAAQVRSGAWEQRRRAQAKKAPP